MHAVMRVTHRAHWVVILVSKADCVISVELGAFRIKTRRRMIAIITLGTHLVGNP